MDLAKRARASRNTVGSPSAPSARMTVFLRKSSSGDSSVCASQPSFSSCGWIRPRAHSRNCSRSVRPRESPSMNSSFPAICAMTANESSPASFAAKSRYAEAFMRAACTSAQVSSRRFSRSASGRPDACCMSAAKSVLYCTRKYPTPPGFAFKKLPAGRGIETGLEEISTSRDWLDAGPISSGIFHVSGFGSFWFKVKRSCVSESASPFASIFTSGNPGCSVQPAANSRTGFPLTSASAIQRSAVVVFPNLCRVI